MFPSRMTAPLTAAELEHLSFPDKQVELVRGRLMVREPYLTGVPFRAVLRRAQPSGWEQRAPSAGRRWRRPRVNQPLVYGVNCKVQPFK